MTPLSLLLSLLDRYRLSQLGLVIFDLFRLDLVILNEYDHQKSNYKTYS